MNCDQQQLLKCEPGGLGGEPIRLLCGFPQGCVLDREQAEIGHPENGRGDDWLGYRGEAEDRVRRERPPGFAVGQSGGAGIDLLAVPVDHHHAPDDTVDQRGVDSRVDAFCKTHWVPPGPDMPFQANVG